MPKTFIWMDMNFKSNLALVVSNPSVKFQINESVFKLKSGNQNILYELKSRIGKWTDTSCKSNLALVVSNQLIKFQIDWTKRLRVRVWKPKYFE